MDRDKALDKIRKLLALAESDNANEAATALRQAQYLMRKYGIDQHAVDIAAVESSETTAGRSTMPVWMSLLARTVANAFGCKHWIEFTSGPAKVHFMGIGAKSEIASYAFTVLRRKLTADRAIFYRTTRGKRPGRIDRADQFAIAWVFEIHQEVERFADLVPGIVETAFEKKAIEKGFQQREQSTKLEDSRAISSGRAAGCKVRLQQGVGGYKQGLIGTSS